MPITETGLVNKYYSPERFEIDLEPKNLEVLQNEKKSFFKNLIQILISPELFSITSSQFSLAINNAIKNFTEKEKQMRFDDQSKIVRIMKTADGKNLKYQYIL